MPDDNDQLLGEKLGTSNKPNESDQDEHDDGTQNYLELLVGEGKKYADIDNLAKGYAHIQAHAAQVLEEKKALEAELEKERVSKKTIEDVLAAIKQKPAAPEGDDDDFDDNQNGDQGAKLTQDEIAKLVAATLDQRDKEKEALTQEEQVKANQAKSWEMLEQVYGDKAKAKLAVSSFVGDNQSKLRMVNELGSLDPVSLLDLIQAKVKPEKGIVDFGLSGMSNSSPGGGKPVKKDGALVTYAEAEALRKSNPAKYKSRNYQLLMHKSCAENPHFWDGINRRKR